MATVYLTSTNDVAIAGNWYTNFSRLKKSALTCNQVHSLVEQPDYADIILFSDSPSITQGDVRRHDLAKHFHDRIFIFSTHDKEIPIFPGVYTCAERRWYYPSHMRPGFYIRIIDHDWIQPSSIDNEARHLFSFCGAFNSHPLRNKLASLRGTSGIVRDTSNYQWRTFDKDADIYRRWQTEYFQSIRESKFILCPRGVAPSSYRIFETMKAGRVPVIIADDWVPPVGPNWAQFSVRVPEARLQEVPILLESIADSAPDMGLRAQQAWQRWFSTDQAFNTVVEWCLQIKKARLHEQLLWRCQPFLQLGRPYFFRYVLLKAAKRRALRRNPGYAG